MKTLSARRDKVRSLRDKAIQRARDECNRTLARIATMEFNRRTMVSTCVESVIPDHEFTVLDILAALESLDPVRVWRRHAVNNHLSRMRDRGQIRRTRRRCGRADPAVYASVEVDVPKRPFGNVSLVEAIAAVRGNRTMNAIELTIAVIEAGYETRMGRKAIRDAVGAAMRKDGRFKRNGDKWDVC